MKFVLFVFSFANYTSFFKEEFNSLIEPPVLNSYFQVDAAIIGNLWATAFLIVVLLKIKLIIINNSTEKVYKDFSLAAFITMLIAIYVMKHLKSCG